MQETYNSLKQIVDSVEQDLAKAASGNKAAGTRVRKQMQEVKSLAQELRKQIIEVREG